MGDMQEQAWQAVINAMTERVKNSPRGELSAIASQIGVTRGTVSRWISGSLKGRRIPYDKMLRIMDALGLEPAEYYGPGAADTSLPQPQHAALQLSETHAEYTNMRKPSYNTLSPNALSRQQSFPFLPDSFDEADYYQVPWLEACASMGGGSLEVSREVKSYLSFRRDWLLSKGNVNRMVAISVEGDSMSPTVPDGSVVLINDAATTPVNNKIYFVCYRDEIFLKRLKVKNGQVEALISDKDGSEIKIKKGEYFSIIGRAIWYGKEL